MDKIQTLEIIDWIEAMIEIARERLLDTNNPIHPPWTETDEYFISRARKLLSDLAKQVVT